MRVAVIGGGAAGLTCAVAIKKADTENRISVTVLEGRDRVGKKLLATGNGRCNMMNRNFSADFYSSPRFVAHTTERFSVDSNLSFFSKIGLYTRQDSEGRIYPLSNQATSVLDTLRFECDSMGVVTRCSFPVTSIVKTKAGYRLNEEETVYDAVVLACGSGASVKGYSSYNLLESLGHNVITPRPSLTKICVKELSFCKRLKGIRCKSNLILKQGDSFIASESGEILFTDFGLSGIAVMQLSAYIARARKIKPTDFAVKIDFVPEMDFDSVYYAIKNLIFSRKSIKTEELLCGIMPKRLGEEVLKSLDISLGISASVLTDKMLRSIASKCKGFVFNVTGLKDLSEAQVACGGAKLSEWSEYTMESNMHRGLYCCGEMLDIDGLCGGYNLMWAFSSARLCAESIVKKGLNR